MAQWLEGALEHLNICNFGKIPSRFCAKVSESKLKIEIEGGWGGGIKTTFAPYIS